MYGACAGQCRLVFVICCCRYWCYCRLPLLLTSILCSIYIYVRTHTHAHTFTSMSEMSNYVCRVGFFFFSTKHPHKIEGHVLQCMKTLRKTRARVISLKIEGKKQAVRIHLNGIVSYRTRENYLIDLA